MAAAAAAERGAVERGAATRVTRLRAPPAKIWRAGDRVEVLNHRPGRGPHLATIHSVNSVNLGYISVDWDKGSGWDRTLAGNLREWVDPLPFPPLAAAAAAPLPVPRQLHELKQQLGETQRQRQADIGSAQVLEAQLKSKQAEVKALQAQTKTAKRKLKETEKKEQELQKSVDDAEAAEKEKDKREGVRGGCM